MCEICNNTYHNVKKLFPCNFVKKIPYIETLEELDIRENILLNEIPSLPNLIRLHCNNTHLTYIPTFPKLDYFVCVCNLCLEMIEIQPNLTILYCYMLPKLQIIHPLVSLKKLLIIQSSIQILPHIPNIISLCIMKTEIEQLPLNLPFIESLDISESIVYHIPDYITLKYLICFKTFISLLPENLPELTLLDVAYSDVVRIPKYKKLLSLNCSITKVFELPILPKLNKLTCYMTKLKNKFPRYHMLYYKHDITMYFLNKCINRLYKQYKKRLYMSINIRKLDYYKITGLKIKPNYYTSKNYYTNKLLNKIE